MLTFLGYVGAVLLGWAGAAVFSWLWFDDDEEVGE